MLRPLRRPRQHVAHRGVGVLQPVERQPRLAVVVLQQPHQLVAGGAGRFPVGKELAYLLLLGAEVRGGRQRRAAAAQRQIVDQDDAVAGGDRPDLMDAVRVEGGERDIGGLLGAQVDDRLALPVADDQLTSGARHRQGQHQGGDHSVLLLGVPVGGEEPASLVDQQLVQMRAGCARVRAGGQPSPVAARTTICSRVSRHAPPVTRSRAASICRQARTEGSTSVCPPRP